MNVAFVNTKRFWGGGEKLHFEYALKFQELGHNVFVITSKNSPLHKKCQTHGLKTFLIHLGNLSFLNPLKYIALRKFYRKENIDTIIISNSPDLKTSGIAAHLSAVNKIVYLRGLAVPIKKNILNTYLFEKVITHLVPNSYETKKTTLSGFNIQKLEKKTKVIYHGIDITDFEAIQALAKLKAQKGEIILGNAGRLVEQKGHRYLIEVADYLHQQNINFKLYIAGEGPMRSELEKLVKQKGLEEKVIFLGFVKEMTAFMKALDISLLSSVWEGFGYVIVEAMAAEKPVVAFDISSNPEIITQNQTGYLVKFPDTQEFATKVKRLIEDPALRKTIGQNGKQSVIDRFLLDDRIIEFEHYIFH
jgi:glycosyltransferase involved in cell wall biosynthesis